MTLKQLIIDNALTGKTAAEITTALNALTVNTISQATITIGEFVEALTPKQANDALAALKLASATNDSLAAIYQRFVAQGVQHVDLRALRKVNAPDEFVKRIRAVLEPNISLAFQAGLGVIAEVDVQAVLDEIAAQAAIDLHNQIVAEIINEVFNANKFKSLDELKKAVVEYKKG